MHVNIMRSLGRAGLSYEFMLVAELPYSTAWKKNIKIKRKYSEAVSFCKVKYSRKKICTESVLLKSIFSLLERLWIYVLTTRKVLYIFNDNSKVGEQLICVGM
jgi:hypothetical protein